MAVVLAAAVVVVVMVVMGARWISAFAFLQFLCLRPGGRRTPPLTTATRQAKSRTVQALLRWQTRFNELTDIGAYRHLVKQCLMSTAVATPQSGVRSSWGYSPSLSRAASVASFASSASTNAPPQALSLSSLSSSSSSTQQQGSGGVGPRTPPQSSVFQKRLSASSSSLLTDAGAVQDVLDSDQRLTNMWIVDLRWLRNFKNDPILSKQNLEFGEIAAPRIRTPKASGGSVVGAVLGQRAGTRSVSTAFVCE